MVRSTTMSFDPTLLPDVMRTLGAQTKVFHSEADFQHAFAWELHHRFPESSVRLERPLRTNGKTLHLDFLMQLSEKSVAVELKYKTKQFRQEILGERYELANHGAHDIGGYDFIKDIYRLEEICAHVANCEGWAIMLTNDSSYWENPKTSAFAALRLTEGKILHGAIGWSDNTALGTKRGREKILELIGKYTLNWKDYTTTSDGTRFRYLALRVVALQHVGISTAPIKIVNSIKSSARQVAGSEKKKNSAKDFAREYFSNPTTKDVPITLVALAILGGYTEINLKTAISDLKNKKYSGTTVVTTKTIIIDKIRYYVAV